MKIKNYNMETILVKLARFQFHFSGIEIQEIWGPDKYQHYGMKWVQVDHNILDFFVALDEDNRKIFLKYLEEKTGLE